MAGDWIKVQAATVDKPEVFLIADALGIDPDAVVGKLIRVWIWADQQTFDGNAGRVTRSLLDRLTSVSGFADAMIECGWLVETEGGLSFPNFDRHNGKTAKSRALTQKRVHEHRNASSVTSALPEKRRGREDKYTDTGDRGKNGGRSKGDEPEDTSENVLAEWRKIVGVPQPRDLNAARRKKLRTRLKEPGWPWREALARLPLPGDGSDSPWQPSIDWLIKNTDNARRIADGEFDFRAGMARNGVNRAEPRASSGATNVLVPMRPGGRGSE